MRIRLVVAVLAVALLVPVAALAAGGGPHLARDLVAAGGVLVYHDGTGFARFYNAPPSPPAVSAASPRAPEAVAACFLSTYGPLFGIDDVSTQLWLRASDAAGPRTTLRFTQVHEGVPVVGGELVVQVADGRVTTVSGETAPVKAVATQPALSAADAADAARQAIAKARDLPPEALLVDGERLAVYYPPLLGPGPDLAVLVWEMDLSAQAQGCREHVLVDAVTGGIALHFDSGEQARDREVYDAAGGSGLPGTLRRSEDDAASGDAEVDAAYDFVGDFYDYYSGHFGRDSFDGSGAALVTSVRYGSSCPNAFWNGSQTIFCADMATDDIVGHEFTHAVTQYTSGLYYYYQSGALNEGLSDVFGELIDLSNGSADDTAAVRWQLGEGSDLGVLRDLGNPSLHNNPDRLTSAYWYCSYNAQDNGGVHANSTVLGKAASLIADGGSFNGSTVTGLGLDKTGAIFYEMQTHLLTSGSDYADVHELLPQACRNLIGSSIGGSNVSESDCTEVDATVAATEMDLPPAVCGHAEAPYCPAGKTCSDLYFDDMENPGAGHWTSYKISGSNLWYYPQYTCPYYDVTYATSGTTNIYGDTIATASNSAIAMTAGVALPAGTQAYLRFNHSYLFEFQSTHYYDGGVVEYSVDDGSTWQDAGSLFDANGYTGTLSTSYGNPLGGRRAFTAGSLGYTSSRLNLAALAGESVRFRFLIGTDNSTRDWGWYVDDFRLYTAVDTATPVPTPDSFAVTINDGAVYTNDAHVTLGLAAPAGYTEIEVSNDGGFAGATWEPFAAAKPWVLSEYGTSALPRTVYVRFRGGLSEETRSDDVVLDRAAPSGSVRVTLSGSDLAQPGQATLHFDVSDETSGITAMLIGNDATFTGAAWQPFAASIFWSGGSGTVYVRFRDGAGNESPTYSASYVAQPQRYLPLLQ